MISTTAEYALRATVLLAKNQGRLVGRAEIAAATCIPLDYSLKVLNALDSAGIVQSKRGPGGGYQLARPADQFTTLDVIRAVDEIPRIKRCPLGIPGHTQLCSLHRLLDEAAKGVEQAFQSVTIEDLAKANRSSSSCVFPSVPS